MNKTGIYVIFLLTALIYAREDISERVSFTSKGVNLSNAIIAEDARGREVFTVADLTYKGGSIPRITDLVLSFNSPASSIIKDDTDKYNIQNSSFRFIKGKGVLGGGGASFFKSDHRIEIETIRNLWLGSCDDLGSFTIEFRLCPISMKDESILFSRIGYLTGKRVGIEIVFKEGRICVRLHRMFKDSRDKRYDVFLNKGIPLEKKKWYHFSLSFDRISGKLTKHLDGDEDEVVYVTQSGEPYIGVYEPSFACVDLPIAIIGRDYYGYLDEFRISYQHIEDLKRETEIAYGNYKDLKVVKGIPVNRVGVISSPVYSFSSTGTSITLFKWEEVLKKDTFVWMELRICDNLFLRNNKTLNWYRIDNNEKKIYLKRVGDEYLRGRYYQWRAYLVPSPDGVYSPSICNIELQYRIDSPPRAPLFLKVVKADDQFVRLKWKKNVEHDILGYRIYYGLRSKIYDGKIGYIDGKRISNEIDKGKNYIHVDITNSIIRENRERERSILNYPELRNGVLYFFSVSAYDSYKPDTPYNHESSHSREVSARPFAGSEVKLD